MGKPIHDETDGDHPVAHNPTIWWFRVFIGSVGLASLCWATAVFVMGYSSGFWSGYLLGQLAVGLSLVAGASGAIWLICLVLEFCVERYYAEGPQDAFPGPRKGTEDKDKPT